MIADTTFLIELHREQSDRRSGPASKFLARFRSERIRTTIVSAAEFAAGFEELRDARNFLARFPMVRLAPEAAFEASRVDRELMAAGERLGENDTWIAGVTRYYGELLVSNDLAFRRVQGLKLRTY